MSEDWNAGFYKHLGAMPFIISLLIVDRQEDLGALQSISVLLQKDVKGVA